MRTYVIEPQTLFVPYLERTLALAGLDVVAVATDVDVKAIADFAPDVVFIDVDYFDRGGTTALCRIRDAARRATVIAYAAASDATTRASAHISGASEVCSKALGEDEFIRAIGAATGLTGATG